MTKPRRGRPPHRYAIHRARLINFHNFVDETIEIRARGHLFLLGDNGSGKTTVLDAIHLVLTGANEVELNAAARVGSRREDGRSLAGMVLRYDAERGLGNEGGAVAYAVLELVDESEGGRLCVGVGLEATTMDSQVTRWGLVWRGPLDALPLVTPHGGGIRPRTRDELRDALGKSEVFARMTEFRSHLAERLFGGASAYGEVCRFWSMAKAYREIVAGARDFATLFARLLPAPDRGVLGDLLASLRRLDELEASLEALDLQRAYVAGLEELVQGIAKHREEVARYRWLIAKRGRESAAERSAETAASLARAVAARQESDGAVALAEARRRSATDALHSAQSAAPAELLSRLREAERSAAEREGEEHVVRTEEQRAELRLTCARAQHEDAAARFFELWSRLAEEAVGAIEEASRLPSLLPRAATAARGERATAERREPSCARAMPAIGPDAIGELEGARASWRAAASVAQEARGERARAVERARAALASHHAAREVRPSIEGLEAACAELRAAGLEAAPLYALLEPRSGAPDVGLRDLEALVGEATLGALVVDAAELERARPIALAHPGVQMASRIAAEARLPAWVEALLAAPTRPLEARARGVLATVLAQPASLGEIALEDSLGTIECRGIALRPRAPGPRLLGAAARRRGHEARVAIARAALDAAERELASADESVARAVEAVTGIERAMEAVAALRRQEILDAQRTFAERARDVELATEHRMEASERTRRASERKDASERVVAALRARVADDDLEEVERRIEEVRDDLGVATDLVSAAIEQRSRLDLEIETLRATSEAMRARIEHLDRALSAADAELRGAIARLGAEVDDVERWARVTQRGDQFKSVESIEDALRRAERDEHARSEEIAADGSRGIRNLQWGAQLGFTWSRAALRVEDRRGAPLRSVLAELDRNLSEQRALITERTRELMDTLVMGALARELQDQVERLHATVRDMNRLLEGLTFGSVSYQFRVTARSDRAELVGLVRRVSVLDETSRAELRAFLGERLSELEHGGDGSARSLRSGTEVRAARADGSGPERASRFIDSLGDGSAIPELLDYRRWFEYRLVMKSRAADAETELTRELRALGSGGEQGVPNYLLVMALAKLGFDAASARLRPLLFDEAFYGIDAGRRDQLLRFATELGIQLVVASPDQDGVTTAVRNATTLFLVKDERGDVHLAPYHFWNREHDGQSVLSLDGDAPDDEAVCTMTQKAT